MGESGPGCIPAIVDKYLSLTFRHEEFLLNFPFLFANLRQIVTNFILSLKSPNIYGTAILRSVMNPHFWIISILKGELAVICCCKNENSAYRVQIPKLKCSRQVCA